MTEFYDQDAPEQPVNRSPEEVVSRIRRHARVRRVARTFGAVSAVFAVSGVVSALIKHAPVQAEDMPAEIAVLLGKIDDTHLRASSNSDLEYRMSLIAQEISGDPEVVVACDNVTQKNPKSDGTSVAGEYYLRSGTLSGKALITLDNLYCGYIEEPRSYNADPIGKGVLILAHEIAHAGGNHNEGLANCEAVDLFPTVSDRLGLSSFLSDVDELSVSRAMSPAGSAYESAGC